MTHALRKVFIGCWIIYFTLCLLIPVESNNKDYIGEAYLLSFIYFLLSYGFDKFLFYPFFKNHSAKREQENITTANIGFINLLIVLVFLGVLSALFDRLYVQGIDFHQNLRVIKTQMQQNAANRGGISSLANVFYYVLFPLIYPATYLLVHSYKEYRNKFIYLFLFITLFVLAFVATYLSASRMILLTFNISLFGSMCIAANKNTDSTKKLFNKNNILVAIAGGIITILFCCYVFIDRSNTYSQIKIVDVSYTESTLKHLGGESNLQERSEDNPYFSSLLLSWAYLVHNIWIFDSAIGLEQRVGAVSTVGLDTWSCKLLGINCEEEWSFSGKFLSVPGTFYYDLGLLGLLLSSVFTGLLISFFDSFTIKNLGLGPIGIQLSLFFIVVFSPLLFAVNILYFPLILYSFILAKILKRGCSLKELIFTKKKLIDNPK